MKTAFFLTGLALLAGCATGGQKLEMTRPVVDDRTAVTVAPKAGMFNDIPLKPMTASQSAARMN